MTTRTILAAFAFTVAAAVSLPAQTASPAPAANTCIDCHTMLGDPRISPPATLFTDDVHRKAGFTCIFCHGGDSTQEEMESAHDVKKGWRGKPAPRDIPGICAKCHSDAATMKHFNPSLRTDQLAEYRTSGHGKKLFGEGDTRVAQCASCHGAHGIQPVKDSRSPVSGARVAQTCNRCHGDTALMSAYKLPADAYAKWSRSVHFAARARGDTSAPTCNSCHGNHGAAPPEVGSVANVCGTCHSVFAEKFKTSPHWEPFKELNLPGCVTCHENHEIVKPSEAFLSEGRDDKCGSCHEKDSPEGKAVAAMRNDLTALIAETRAAREKVDRAAEAGMEVSRIRFELGKADDALTKARTDVHLFQVAAVRSSAGAGLAVARSARKAAERALKERNFRRRGLFLSLVVILLAITGLLLKIRELSAHR